MERRYIILIVPIFLNFNCINNNKFNKTNDILTHFYINDSTEIIIINEGKNSKTPFLYFYNHFRKDTITIGKLNIDFKSSEPINLIIENDTNTIASNCIKTNNYFIYCLGIQEPFLSNLIFVYDIKKNKLLSPFHNYLNSSNTTGFKSIFSSGFFTRIDTSLNTIETIIKSNNNDVIYFSWNIQTKQIDTMLLKSKWLEVSIDSIKGLNKMANFAKKRKSKAIKWGNGSLDTSKFPDKKRL